MPKPHHWRNPLEKYLNKISRYHYWVYALMFTAKIPMITHSLNLIFLSPPMTYHCSDVDIENISLNYCPCKEPIWNTSVFQSTMQTKFGLYCDTNWQIQFGHSMAYVGQLFGCLFFGFFSDKYGRLNLYSLSCLTIAVFGCLVSVMPSAASFILMRFLEGVGVGGCIVTSYVLCVEYVGVRHREIITALFHLPINIGHVTIPGISYLLRDMDEFQLALSVPMFLFVGTKWMIMESPKWLMDNDYVDEVAQGLQRMTSQTNEEIKDEIKQYKASHNLKRKGQKVKFWHIFKHRRLALNFSCMSFIYFVCGFGYYGVSQFIGTMGGDIHLNVAISGLILLPGTLLCIFLLKLFSRRLFLTVTVFASGICMLGLTAIPEAYKLLRVIFACIANCFFFMSFIIVFLYGVELFPTSVRNSALGVLSVVSRIGQIMAPLTNSFSGVVAASIFGGSAVVGGLMCLPLPETKNSEFPSSLDETKRLNVRRSKDEDVVPDPEASTSVPMNI